MYGFLFFFDLGYFCLCVIIFTCCLWLLCYVVFQTVKEKKSFLFFWGHYLVKNDLII